MAQRQKSQQERDLDDEARLNWFLSAEGTALSQEELIEITGLPASRALSGLSRLADDGLIRRVGPNSWRVSRRSNSEVANL